MKTISLPELEQWQEDERCYALIDVLPDSATQAPVAPENGALDFLEKISHLGLSKRHPIILYEAESAGIEATAAADALLREGFDEVYCFIGPRAPFFATQHTTVGE
jgi:rhodanese-related sulfurtransferase